jgi:hypothetical protein
VKLPFHRRRLSPRRWGVNRLSVAANKDDRLKFPFHHRRISSTRRGTNRHSIAAKRDGRVRLPFHRSRILPRRRDKSVNINNRVKLPFLGRQILRTRHGKIVLPPPANIVALPAFIGCCPSCADVVAMVHLLADVVATPFVRQIGLTF